MKFKKSTLVICIATLLAFVLRTLQIFCTIDQSIGFYKIEQNGLGTFLMALIVVLCMVSAVVARFYDFQPNGCQENDKFTAIASGILAIALFYEIFSERFVFVNATWQAMAMKTVGFLTAVYFAAMLFSAFYSFKIPDLCHTLPAIYMIIRIICSFIGIGSLSLITENIFLIASYCVSLLFFISYAGNKCKVYINGASLYMRSVLAFALCFVTALPNLIVNATSLGGYSHIPLTSQVVLTAITLFIAAFNYKRFLK
jgi:hypothetical protein